MLVFTEIPDEIGRHIRISTKKKVDLFKTDTDTANVKIIKLNQRLLNIIYCVNKNIRSHNELKTSAHDGIAQGFVFIILMTDDGAAIKIVLLLIQIINLPFQPIY